MWCLTISMDDKEEEDDLKSITNGRERRLKRQNGRERDGVRDRMGEKGREREIMGEIMGWREIKKMKGCKRYDRKGRKRRFKSLKKEGRKKKKRKDRMRIEGSKRGSKIKRKGERER